MLVDTEVSAAFKNSLGQYEVKRMSIFSIADIHKYFIGLDIKCNFNGEMELKVKCPLCGEYHFYSYDIVSVIKGGMVIGGCEILGYPVFFIGNKKKIEEKINRYKEVNKKIQAML